MEAEFIKSAFKPAHYPPPDRSEIAFAGKSNVGKSSLINTLLNHKGLAKTSQTPGRTQAINFFNVNGKTNLIFADLPGYGFAKVPQSIKKEWKNMIETYLSTRQNLRLLFVLIDIRRSVSESDTELLKWLKYIGLPTIAVLTKSDKLSKSQQQKQVALTAREIEGLTFRPPLPFSAKTRDGVEPLWNHIYEVTNL